MNDSKPPTPARPRRRKSPGKADAKAARKARLAQALRDNLRRRRAQARARKTTVGDG